MKEKNVFDKRLLKGKNNKRLHALSETVASIGVSEKDAMLVLKDIWEKKPGIQGLSAVQIGVLKRIILVRYKKQEPFFMVNPEIVWTFGVRDSLEGCESVGEDRYNVSRSMIGKVTWQDPEDMSTHAAILPYKKLRIIQHEIDHLNGILISDKGRYWVGNTVLKKGVFNAK